MRKHLFNSFLQVFTFQLSIVNVQHLLGILDINQIDFLLQNIAIQCKIENE